MPVTNALLVPEVVPPSGFMLSFACGELFVSGACIFMPNIF